MPTLNLGVIDVPYSDEGTEPPVRVTKKGRVHKRSIRRAAKAYQSGTASGGPATTVSVAQALEEKYHVMGVFVENHQDDIQAAAVHSLEGALEDLYSGAPIKDPYAELGTEVEAGFRQWLLQGEIESLGVEGVPTKAAIARQSSRFKRGAGPSERPSFIDTGLYELSMRSWVE